MPKLYENSKVNFANFDHFKEVAVKTINELFGRVRPLDVFDFSQNSDTFKCVAYYDDEVIPEQVAEGDVVNDDEADKARALHTQNLMDAAHEASVATDRINAMIATGDVLTEDDKQLAAQLGIEVLEEDPTTDLPEVVDGNKEETYDLETVLKASDAAIKLASENEVDLKLVTGTGSGGNITKADVQAYIDNKAPVTENADDQIDNKQSNT